MNGRDGQWLTEMAREHNPPFWVLFPRVPQTHYFELLDAFRGISKELKVCYSVKTNPHEKILQALDQMHSGFECVSLRELKQIQKFEGPKIFNSCASSLEELKEALSQNALIVIDSLSQAELLSTLTGNKPLKVGLRVRFDHRRFGFSPGEVKEAIAALEKMNLRVKVMHSHPGTNCSLNHYRNFIAQVSQLVQDFPFLEGVDLGGGIPGKTALVERKERLEAYAQIVHERLGDFLKNKKLYLEPGRFLVEDSMVLVSKVRHVKNVDGQRFALLDVGVNVLPRATMNQFRFFALTQSGQKKQHFRLGGPLMFGTDEVGHLTAALKQGDLVAVENTGAYCTEMAWQLSFDLPPIVCIE